MFSAYSVQTVAAASLQIDAAMPVVETLECSSLAAGSSNPLLNSSLLQNLLGYVGPGHHLFVAPVSKWWYEIYAILQSVQLTVPCRIRYEKIIDDVL
jgi:hypothetical protein